MQKILIEVSRELVGLGEALKSAFEIQYLTQPFFKHISKFNPDIVILNPTNFNPLYKNDNYTIVINGKIIDDVVSFPIKLAVDITKFGGGQIDLQYKSNYLYISEHQVDMAFIQKLSLLSKVGLLKCVGPYPLDMIEYLGTVNLEQLNNFMASAEYVISYDNIYFLETWVNGSFPIGTKENNMGVGTLDDLITGINCKVDFNPLQGDTYHHRAISLIEELGLSNEAYQILGDLNVRIDKIRNITR